MGQVLGIVYRVQTPYRDGTTHVIFEPLDFKATPEARFQY